jgi:hypothetical protein
MKTHTFSKSSLTVIAVLAIVGGCGGGGSDAVEPTQAPASAPVGSGGGGGAPTPLPSPVAPPAPLSVKACEPIAGGRDIQVGPGTGQIANLDQVAWESLKAGDTVRIFYKSTPYKGKILITAEGTASQPVRVCGVKGANGERPVIDGNGAVTRKSLVFGGNGIADQTTGEKAKDVQEARAVIMIKSTLDYTQYPKYVQIDGLKVTGSHPRYKFTDTTGATKAYKEFGACIWVDRGHNITIADNEITDCSHAIFTKSTDDGPFAVTKNVRIAGNKIWNNGIAGSDRIHHTYTASQGIVFEFNVYGALRSGANGNAIKDRSSGTIVRYNRIEDGARAVDLVEAEDFPETALADAAYRTTFVYGNQIIKDGNKGSTIHYGGDHNLGSTPTGNYGTRFNRKGTLYFFYNTVRLTGNGYAVLFQLSTTEEKAEIWNNVFIFDSTIPSPYMRSTTEVETAYWQPGGLLNFGPNWISQNWKDASPYATIKGGLTGTSNLITGTEPPVDVATFAPKAGSTVIDKAATLPDILKPFVLEYELIGAGYLPQARKQSGASADLGARELQ